MLLASSGDFQWSLVAKALVTFKGIPLYDATRLARNSRGIVGEKLDEEAARQLAASLEGVGCRVIVVAQDGMAVIPGAELVTMIEALAQGWRFHLKDSSLVEVSFEQVHLMAALSYDEISQKTKQIKEGPTMGQRAVSIGIMMTTGLPINIGGKTRTVTKTQRQTATFYAADIIALEPMRRFKIDAQNFNYACLKDRKGYNAFNNFRLLIGDLAGRSPSCQRNAGIKVLVDARPIHEMAYDSMDAYEREIRWLLTIKSLSRERNTK